MGTDDAVEELPTHAQPPDLPEQGDLLRLLASSDLAWLLGVVLARAADGTELVGPVSLLTATPAQRAAAAALFGRRPALRGATVRLEELDALLRTSGAWPAGLADAAASVADGVLVLPPTPLAQTQSPLPQPPPPIQAPPQQQSPLAPPAPPRRPAPETTWTPLDHLPTSPVDWLSWWREERSGDTPAQLLARVGSAGAATEIAAQLADVLDLLPATGELRADLAEAVTGSPTDLDDGPLATLVLRALRWRSRSVEGTGDDEDVARVWASAGVVCDELADTVLTLGLSADASSPTGAALEGWAAVGQPVVLTFRHLRLDPPRWRTAPPGGAVHVCGSTRELGTLVGASSASRGELPVRAVCVGELASVSAQLVLAGLRDAGWQLREHATVHPDRVGRHARGRAELESR